VYCFQAVKTTSLLKEYGMKVYFLSSAGTSKKVHRIIKSKAVEGRIECLQQLTLKDVPWIISESKGMGLIKVFVG
tara:strand:- start:327 stop:551 length:225 start_codon:yes stop_codon:yes gene_type:complete